MKTLLLIRHAKSSWGDFSIPDFDRPLNERGKKDAPMMAERLLGMPFKLDACFSSTAKRAESTCRIFSTVHSLHASDLHFIENLYLPGFSAFAETITAMDNRYSRVALFSHNPGITEFANLLCKHVVIDDMPTCSIFAVRCDIDSWIDFKPGENSFLFFDFPKKPLSK